MEECLAGYIPRDLELMDHQLEALDLLENGNILFGGVGAGKSAVALAYYVKKEQSKDIYVITTAKKRDSLDWMGEAAKFGIGMDIESTCFGVMTVDSWNNLGNYTEIEDAFFIFDEQRLVGHGAWVKSFLKIAKRNHWIMLTATPGDVWLDYMPVFIANGWYKNFTDFRRQHVVYAAFSKYPKVVGMRGEAKLERLRSEVLVEMPYIKHTERILNFMDVGYDKQLWDIIVKDRWHIYEDRPIYDAGEMFRLMRRLVNTDPSRLEMVLEILRIHPKLVIFYNFDYELEILRGLVVDAEVGEWNGHRHDPIPDSDTWVYLVQYNSGSESWNCIETDAMILYSLTYSYKNYIQCQGRIDRLDTPYTSLYYYILVSNSPIDTSIRKSLNKKRSFNEREMINYWEYPAKNFALHV